MLELRGRNSPRAKPVTRLAPPVAGLVIGPEPFPLLPAVPLLARDAYVAETSTRIEFLERDLAAANAELSALHARIIRLEEDADQSRRFTAFLDRESRRKSADADGVVRVARDLKARLDRIEARSSGNYHGYATFEAISKRLTELGDAEAAARRAVRHLSAAGLGAGLVVLLALAAGLIF